VPIPQKVLYVHVITELATKMSTKSHSSYKYISQMCGITKPGFDGERTGVRTYGRKTKEWWSTGELSANMETVEFEVWGRNRGHGEDQL